jgi:hypothetical protein
MRKACDTKYIGLRIHRSQVRILTGTPLKQRFFQLLVENLCYLGVYSVKYLPGFRPLIYQGD